MPLKDEHPDKVAVHPLPVVIQPTLNDLHNSSELFDAGILEQSKG